VWDWTTLYRGTPGIGFLPGAGSLALLRRFAGFYAATSAAWDSLRAAGNAVAVIVLGGPVLAGMWRLRQRLSFVVASTGRSLSGPA
jgi:energy-coupling factor transport system substrate-specific component